MAFFIKTTESEVVIMITSVEPAIANLRDEFSLNNDEERKIRLAIACNLYRLGKVSQSIGAELAGISRIDFLYELGNHGVSMINIQDDQIQVEIDSIRKLSKEMQDAEK